MGRTVLLNQVVVTLDARASMLISHPRRRETVLAARDQLMQQLSKDIAVRLQQVVVPLLHMLPQCD